MNAADERHLRLAHSPDPDDAFIVVVDGVDQDVLSVSCVERTDSNWQSVHLGFVSELERGESVSITDLGRLVDLSRQEVAARVQVVLKHQRQSQPVFQTVFLGRRTVSAANRLPRTEM